MSFGSDVPSSPQRHTCECYKKLLDYGIPLFIDEEDDLYAENADVIPRESAFKLPGILRVNEDVAEYPIVDENELIFVFQRMARVLPKLGDFEENVVSFWILDVFIEGLWTAQSAKMSHGHQKATLLWIAYLFNFIQRQNPTRAELFQHLKEVLFRSEFAGENECEGEKRSIQSGEVSGEDESSKWKRAWILPMPPALQKGEDSSSSFSDEQSPKENDTVDTEKSTLALAEDWGKEETDTEVNLEHMNIILEILYRIFARLWVFQEIQTVFHAMPSIEQVDLPFALNVPKPLLKSEPPSQTKPERGSKRPSLSEKPLEEVETERQLHKHDYILPLQAAEESKLYLKQFLGHPGSDRSVLRHKEERTKK